MDGVVRTRVGYAGGTTESPSYTCLGDHTEVVRIWFDPARITYSRLLDVFWSSHDPASTPWSTQYRSLIFAHGEQQRRIAEESRDREAERLGRPLNTEILPAGEFTQAEDYHQKYGLQHFAEIASEFHAMYPDFQDIVDSTAAARVNGYVSGYGTLSELEVEIDGFGLSPRGRELLLEHVSMRP